MGVRQKTSSILNALFSPFSDLAGFLPLALIWLLASVCTLVAIALQILQVHDGQSWSLIRATQGNAVRSEVHLGLDAAWVSPLYEGANVLYKYDTCIDQSSAFMDAPCDLYVAGGATYATIVIALIWNFIALIGQCLLAIPFHPTLSLHRAWPACSVCACFCGATALFVWWGVAHADVINHTIDWGRALDDSVIHTSIGRHVKMGIAACALNAVSAVLMWTLLSKYHVPSGELSAQQRDQTYARIEREHLHLD